MAMNGLTSKQVQERVDKGLVNKSSEHTVRTNGQIIKANTLTFFNLIMVILLVLVLITGSISNILFIFPMLFNLVVGIYQEIKARNLLQKMNLMVESRVDVLRDGSWNSIGYEELVQNDVVKLKAGMQVPSDGQVLDGYLEVNESILTGESNTRIKRKGDELYGGSVIASGEAVAEIVHVGQENFSEQIMKDARKYKPVHSELNETMTKLLRILSYIILPLGIILFYTQYRYLDMTWQQADLKTVSALVGMIPEGLVVLTSIALSVSTMRLSRQEVLVQDMYSIETLARVDVICTDKTGTLTSGDMQVTEVIPAEGNDMERIQKIMGSYTRVFHEGNATANALAAYFPKNEEFHETNIIPFSSDRKYSGASFAGEGTFYVGAANFLFPERKTGLEKNIRTASDRGDRVVLLAHSAHEDTGTSLPSDLEPLAMIAIRDVLRPNVQNILQYFHKQGVAVKVISGDDPRTVSALAMQAGLDHAERYVDMSQQRFRDPIDFVDQMTVFGRVLPDQKKAMVEALQRQGHTVAMIGDGVNDVPALKAADVGIAMAAGTSAAKDSGNIVLLNSDFGSMPDIVNEGRRVINNITRASSMYLVKTFFSILLSLFVIFMHIPYPFLPIQLSILTTFGVGVPTFFLQMESSFEPIRGKLFKKVVRNALPPALSIFLITLFVELIKGFFGINESRCNLILLTLSLYAYLYALYRVYYPLNKLRRIILYSMTGAAIVSMFLLHEQLQIQVYWADLFIIIPGAIIIPVLVAAIARAYDWCAVKIKNIRDWFSSHNPFRQRRYS